MKNWIYLLVAMSIMLAGCTDSKENPEQGTETEEMVTVEDANEMQLVSEKYFVDNELTTYSEYKYSPDNNSTEGYTYFANGTLKSHYLEEYDSNGNLLSYVCYDSNEHVTERREYSYNERGEELTCTTYMQENPSSEMLTYTTENKYNATGQLIQIMRNENGMSYIYNEFEYDEDGNKLLEKTVLPDGSISSITSYTYDDSGLEISSSTDFPGLGWTLRTEKAYDEKGNVIQELNYNGDTPSLFIYSEYDAQGNPLSERYESYSSSTGALEDTFTTKYEYTYETTE